MDEILNAETICSATVIRGAHHVEKTGARGHYEVECRDADGNLKWADEIENTIMDQGKSYMLDNALNGGAVTVITPVMGLVTNAGFGGSYSSTDTYALHADFTESTVYTVGRKTMTWAAASGTTKVANSVTFIMNNTDTIKGCCVFFSANTTPGNTAAASSYLLSAGNFTGGDKPVINLDQIIVTYTFQI